MGFYGQILYEFSRLFSQINIQNNNNESAAATNDDLQASLAPTEQWDRLTLKGGNRWIQLNSNTADKIITISHSEPGAIDESKTVVGFKKINSLPEGAAATELKAGDLIQTTLSEYDAAGHSRGATSSYFILPESETEKNLDDITDRVSKLENTYVSENEFNTLAETYLTENEYIQTDEFEKKTQDYLDTNKYINAQNLDENEEYVTTKITGTLDEMYGDEEAKSLASTIGTMIGEDSFISDLKKLLNYPDNYDIQFTVSEALKALSQEILTQAENLQRVQIAQAELLALNNELRTRLETVEEQLKTLTTPTE